MSLAKTLAGPAYISASGANIYTPAASPIVTILKHIHIANRTNADVTFSLYVGATGASAAGTELFGTKTVVAYDTFDYYCEKPMLSTEFLVGIASAGSSLVITITGEYEVSV